METKVAKLIKTVIDDDGKWEVYLNDNGLYDVKYYEYFSSCGYRLVYEDPGFCKEVLNWAYGFEV